MLAHEVAAAYLDAPRRRDPLTEAAYADLATESDRLFRRIEVGSGNLVCQHRIDTPVG